MHQKYLKLASVTALMLSSVTAMALPFNSFDPRSMAMGGTGVAVGDPSSAPFFNPALLTASDPKLKYSVELPIIGVRLYDPGNLRTNLNTLSNDISALDAAVATATATPSVANFNAVASKANTVNSLLSSINNQPIQGEVGAAAVIGVPGKDYGAAFYTDAWGAVGGLLEYNDATTLTNFSNTVSTCAIDPFATGCSTLTAPTLTSKIHLRGVLIKETGLALSHGFVVNDKSWSLGITPKIMQLQVFDALLGVNSGSSISGVTGNDYMAKYSSLNFDLGAAKSYLNGWRTGVTVKNVLPQSFDFKRAPTPGATPVPIGSSLKLNPLVRAGVSHENDWSTVAFDLDLTQNDPAGLENKSQYAALGGELSALGWAQIRAGYRADLLSAERNVTSVGLGISPRVPYFKFHFDLAYAYNKKEEGASLRFGLNF